MPEPHSGEALERAFERYKRMNSALPRLASDVPDVASFGECGLWGVFVLFTEENETEELMAVQLGSVLAVLGIVATPAFIKELLAFVAAIAGTNNNDDDDDDGGGAKKPAVETLSFRLFRALIGILQKIRFLPLEDESESAAAKFKQQGINKELKAVFVEFDREKTGSMLFTDLVPALKCCGISAVGHEAALAELMTHGEGGERGEGEEEQALDEATPMSFADLVEIIGQDVDALEKVDVNDVMRRALRFKHRVSKDSARSRRTGVNVALKVFESDSKAEEILGWFKKSKGTSSSSSSSSYSRRDAAARAGACACAVAGGSALDVTRCEAECKAEAQRIVDRELVDACRRSRKDLVDAALACGADPTARQDQMPHRTALMSALDAGADVECPLALIAAGADCAATDADGATALMLAARGAVTSEHHVLLTKLIEARPTTPQKQQEQQQQQQQQHRVPESPSPTRNKSRPDFAKQAETADASSSDDAANERKKKKTTTSSSSTAKYPAVHATAIDGMTALHYAASFGRTHATRLLLEHDADPDPVTKMKISPLMLAAKSGHQRCVELLLAFGVNPDRKDRHKKTALDYAVRHEQPTVAEILKNACDKQSTQTMATSPTQRPRKISAVAPTTTKGAVQFADGTAMPNPQKPDAGSPSKRKPSANKARRIVT